MTNTRIKCPSHQNQNIKKDTSNIVLYYWEKDKSALLYMICLITLSNEVMVPSKCQYHLITYHLQHKNKPKQYAEMQKKNHFKIHSISKKAQTSTYKIAQQRRNYHILMPKT